MKRGGLIFPIMAKILPFVGANQDPDFKEPLHRSGGACSYGKPYLIACQIEPCVAQAMAMQPNGDDVGCRIGLVFNDSGQLGKAPTPKPRDRLSTLLSVQGKVLQDFNQYDGLYAVEVAPLSFGLFRGRGNIQLLRGTFQSRSRAARRVG